MGKKVNFLSTNLLLKVFSYQKRFMFSEALQINLEEYCNALGKMNKKNLIANRVEYDYLRGKDNYNL